MQRLFTFHLHDSANNDTVMLPAYYVGEDYGKASVRVYAIIAPATDAKIDILADGVSIFRNHKTSTVNRTTGVISEANDYTYITLPAGSNSDEMAEDFNDSSIEQGSWLTCKLVDGGGGKDFTVTLELEPLSEPEEDED